jgi:tetratricopeptide (TPR) repeat protein
LKKYITILFVIIPVLLSAQDPYFDTLKLKLKSTKIVDTNYVWQLDNLSWTYKSFGDFDSALRYAKLTVKFGEQINYQTGIAIGYLDMGLALSYQGNYPASHEAYNKALTIYQRGGKKKGIASTYNNIGTTFRNEGKYKEALEIYFKALAIMEELKNEKGKANVYSNISGVYKQLNEYEQALKYARKSLVVWSVIQDEKNIAMSYGNIGAIYTDYGKPDSAGKYQRRALVIREKLNDRQGLALSYDCLASDFYKKKKWDSSLVYYKKALAIALEMEEFKKALHIYSNNAMVYLETKKYKFAEENVKMALDLAYKINSREDILNTEEVAASVYEQLGEHQLAFKHIKKQLLYKDSIFSDETRKKSVQAEMNFEFSLKERMSKLEQEKKDVQAAEEKRVQTIIIYSVSLGLFLVLILAVVIFRSLQTNKKKNEIITLQKMEVEEQKHVVEEKQKEILDSIKYAKRIQNALLPSDKYFSKHVGSKNK